MSLFSLEREFLIVIQGYPAAGSQLKWRQRYFKPLIAQDQRPFWRRLKEYLVAETGSTGEVNELLELYYYNKINAPSVTLTLGIDPTTVSVGANTVMAFTMGGDPIEPSSVSLMATWVGGPPEGSDFGSMDIYLGGTTALDMYEATGPSLSPWKHWLEVGGDKVSNEVTITVTA